MGDIADYYIEMAISRHIDVGDYHAETRYQCDARTSYYHDYRRRYDSSKIHVCKDCGEEIEWHYSKDVWVPLDNGTLSRHVCDEFEVYE